MFYSNDAVLGEYVRTVKVDCLVKAPRLRFNIPGFFFKHK